MSKEREKIDSIAAESRAHSEIQEDAKIFENAESELDSFAKEVKGRGYIQMKVSEIDVYNENLKAYVLSSTKKVPFGEYGQFVSIVLNIDGGRYIRRFTVVDYPDPYSYKIIAYRTEMSGNHILDNWKVGVKVLVSYPEGDFYYNPLLDHRILCITKGQGAIGALGMLKGALKKEGAVKVIYLANSEKEFYLKRDYDQLNEQPSFSVQYVIDDGSYVVDEAGLEEDFKKDFSFFYSSKEKSPTILGELRPKREVYNILGTSFVFRYPLAVGSTVSKTFSLIVRAFGEEYPPIPANSSETLLVAIEKAGIHMPAICRDGKCGYCLSRLIEGDVYIPSGKTSTDSESLYHLIHPCVCYPISDIILDIPLEE